MAVFIGTEDITDSVLAGRVPDVCISNANDYVNRIAAKLGVMEPVPTVTSKQLAVCVACRDCCLGLVGTDPTVTIDGSRNDDVYAQKYKLYSAQIETLEKSMTAADFMEESEEGERNKAWTRSVQINRA